MWYDVNHSPVEERELVFRVLGIHKILREEYRPKEGQIQDDDDEDIDKVAWDNPPSFFFRIVEFPVTRNTGSLQRVSEELGAIFLYVFEASSAPFQGNASGLLLPALVGYREK